jgi:hypothetical protein
MTHNIYSLIAAICAVVLLAAFCFSGLRVFRYLRDETCEPNRYAFIFLLAFQAVLLAIEWPGVVGVDDLYLLKSLMVEAPSPWHSMTYSFLSSVILIATGKPFLLSIFNWVLFSNLLVIVFSMTRWRYQELSYWLLLFILCMPHTSSLVFFQNRDSTYSLLLMIFLLGFLQFRYNRFPNLLMKAFGFVVLGCILGELRQEGKVITLLTPFLMCFFMKLSKKAVFLYSLLTVGLAFVIQFAPSIYYGMSTYTDEYRVTAYLNPVGYIINEIGVDNLSVERRDNIDKVVSIESIVKYPDPYDIAAFHRGGLRKPISKDNFLAFQRESIALIFENPGLYLENRWLIFQRMFLFERPRELYVNAIRFIADPSLLSIFETFKGSGKNVEENLFQIEFYKWVQKYMGGLPLPFHILLSSCFVALLSLAFFAMRFRRNPSFSVIAWIVLGRSALILALAPAAYFKYVTSTWLCGWLLLIIYWNNGGFSVMREELWRYLVLRFKG